MQKLFTLMLILIAATSLLTQAQAQAADWKPVGEKIKTQWTSQVTPENAWREYPRPQMVRENWTNLNGLWDYAVRNAADDANKLEWAGKILVPFCLESSLSGVQRLLQPHEVLHYNRTIKLTKKPNTRLLLHFEAVDYQCEAYVNGELVGKHTGGNTPFSFDITAAAKDGVNNIALSVIDKTTDPQLRGKQVMRAGGIFYTRVSGIWQTVWIEEVPATYIASLKIDTAIKPAAITIKTTVAGDKKDVKVRVTAKLAGKEVAKATGTPDEVKLSIPDAKLWTPETPTLYDLDVELLEGEKTIDSVDSYAGIRTVGRKKDINGDWRMTLNDEFIFHLGPLDQGWWPDGLLTPPCEAAMLFDINYMKKAGFNTIRHHIKVRPRRYYYHCDKIGMMLWQDQVSYRKSPGWTRMRVNPNPGFFNPEWHKQYMYEFKEMVDYLYNSPSIVMWVPFNEAWGQHKTMEVGKWIADYDKTRLVNVASGGNFWPVGDIADHHSYPHPGFPTGDPRFDDYIKVVGEFGGHGYVVDKKHIWNPNAKNWGYGGLPKNIEELQARYAESIKRLVQLKNQGVAGGIYTQTSDIESEINGLMTYDREVKKFSEEFLAEQHKKLYGAIEKRDPNAPKPQPQQGRGGRSPWVPLTKLTKPQTGVVLANADNGGATWKYTTKKPADNWLAKDFDAKGWKEGKSSFGTVETPKAKVATTWNTPEIWIRTEFDYQPKEGEDVVLRVFFDEDPVLYINGVKAAGLRGFVTDYTILQISDEAKKSLKPGKNVIAVYCKNGFGGQNIDVGIVSVKK